MDEIGNDQPRHVAVTGDKRTRREIRAIVEFFAPAQNTRACLVLMSEWLRSALGTVVTERPRPRAISFIRTGTVRDSLGRLQRLASSYRRAICG